MKEWITVDSKDRGNLLNIRELWEYKFLVFLFIRRDFVAKYKQNILGPLWFIMQPVLMTFIFTFVFGKIAGISTQKVPAPLFYLTGLAIWNYFALSFSANATVLVTHAPLYTKVYFPRMSLPLANVIANLLAFGVQSVLVLLFYIYFKETEPTAVFGANWTIVLIPLYVLIAGILSLGLSLWMSSLTAKYRDLGQLAAFFVQIGMYLTPVIYPLAEVPSKLSLLIHLNPMASVVEGFRYSILGQGSFSILLLMYSLLVSLIILLSGGIVFQKVQRSFADSV